MKSKIHSSLVQINVFNLNLLIQDSKKYLYKNGRGEKGKGHLNSWANRSDIAFYYTVFYLVQTIYLNRLANLLTSRINNICG